MARDRVRLPPDNPPVKLTLASDQKEPKKGVFPSSSVVARLRNSKRRRPTTSSNNNNPFKWPSHPPGVVPEDTPQLAQDSAVDAAFGWAGAFQGAWNDGLLFMGYAELAVMAQRPEFRIISAVLAEEMTREWIEFESVSDDEEDEDHEFKEDEHFNDGLGKLKGLLEKTEEQKKSSQDKINELEEAIKNFKLKEAFEDIAVKDGWFGRSHLYVDCCDPDDREELKTSIGGGKDLVSVAKFTVKTGEEVDQPKLKAFRPVEAIWTYPTRYDSVDPLKPDWYKPITWFVMGKEVHYTRLLTFVGRPVPDILKPAYSFGGLSLTQMAKPYVDNFLRTRQSVSDLIHSFVVQGLKTNLAALMNAQGDDLINRMEAFNALRDNHDAFLLDNETEDWFNVSTPLGGLSELQAQSQEQIASVSRIPLVKLLGISPHGLNATAEPEIRVFYDTIKAMQEKFFREHLTSCIHFIMLNLWGEIDENITFKFKDLWQLDEVAAANAESVRTSIDETNVGIGAIDPEEVRQRIAKDKGSQYTNIDLSGPPPEPPDPMGGMGGGMPPGEGGLGGPPPGGPGGGPSGPGSGKKAPLPSGAGEGRGGVADAAPEFFKSEVEFEHPAQGKNSCGECQHFNDGNDTCEVVKGLIRAEDWCELWEDEEGLGHWLVVGPTDEDDDEEDDDEDGAEDVLAADDWEEDKHPRDKGGQFTSGSGGGGGSKPEFPKTSHQTKVKNSIAKTLSAAGYSKKKKMTGGGHHVFEHGGTGHQVFVGPSKENQEFISGYRLAGTHKFGSGAGALAKHLSELHNTPVEAGYSKPKPKEEVAKPPSSSSGIFTQHPASKVQEVMIQAGGKLYNSNSATTTYQLPDQSAVVFSNTKLPGTSVYKWSYVSPAGKIVGQGQGAAQLQANLSSLQQLSGASSSKKKNVAIPPAMEKSLTGEGHYVGSSDSPFNTPGTESSFETEHGYGYLTTEIGGDKWHINTYDKDGNYKEKSGEGQESLNAAFEALHPRGAHGEFIKKPEGPVQFEQQAVNELEKQGFKHSPSEDSYTTYKKDDVTVEFYNSGHWIMKQSGNIINQGNHYYSDIFATQPPKDPDVGFDPEKAYQATNPSSIPAVATQAKAAVGKPLDFTGMKKTGEKLGSNPGGTYEDADGNKYYIKQPQTNDHAKNEILSAALYSAVGGNTLNYHQVVDGDKMYVATDWQLLDKKNINDFTPADKKKAQKDFAIHVWLANWDATGIDNSNMGVKDGKVVPLDFGGSLLYRAQGSPKGPMFNTTADEWSTLRDPHGKNPYAAKLYGDMTPDELKESAKQLENISFDQIKDLVNQYGPGDAQDKQQLALKLLQRKEAVLGKANQKAPPPPPPAPKPEEVKPQAGVATLMHGLPSYSSKWQKGGNQLVVDPSDPTKNYSTVYKELDNDRPTPNSSEEHYVGAYTGSYYHDVNDCLRYLTDCEHIKGIQELRSYVSRAKTKKPLTLFRGVQGQYMEKMKQQFSKAHKAGKAATFADGGFLSMSTAESTALNFAGSQTENMFIIEVPAGSHVASANNFSEYELIGQLGTVLTVTGKDPVTGYWKAKLDQSHMQEKAPE